LEENISYKDLFNQVLIEINVKKNGRKVLCLKLFFLNPVINFFFNNNAGLQKLKYSIIDIFNNRNNLIKTYNLLSDDKSKKTFIWFIKYRIMAYFTGLEIDKILPSPTRSPKLKFYNSFENIDYNKNQNLNLGKYKIYSSRYEIGHTWFLESYFLDKKILPPKEGIVIDVGAYCGETSIWYSKKMEESGIIYAFEPVKVNFNNLVINIENNALNKVIHPYNLALGNKEGEIKFFENGDESRVSENSQGQYVSMTKLDKFIKENNIAKVDYIKIDTEGYDLEVIKGARNCIYLHKPFLAIAIYHKARDIFEIPLFIHSIVPEYKFYISHKAEDWQETILFASAGNKN